MFPLVYLIAPGLLCDLQVRSALEKKIESDSRSDHPSLSFFFRSISLE